MQHGPKKDVKRCKKDVMETQGTRKKDAIQRCKRDHCESFSAICTKEDV